MSGLDVDGAAAHQLHSSTTVDDIAICEAYLHFLHTGVWDDFWAHLWDCAGLSREDLAAMKVGWRNESGITGPANHMPHMIPDFQHLLWILKVIGDERVGNQRPLHLPTTIRRLFGSSCKHLLSPAIERLMAPA